MFFLRYHHRVCHDRRTDSNGFTLVELMIALFVSLLVMAALTTVYITQNRNYSQQDALAEIQQDLRGALVLLPLEMRLAGCDPTESGAASILNATRTSFNFTLDVRGNAVNPESADGEVDDANENITFGFNAATDQNNNGIVDNGGADWSGTESLRRDTGGGLQPLADNIEALEFNYILDDGTATLAPANLNDIRVVQVSILARSPRPTEYFVNNATYTTASGIVWDPPNDNFRRRLVVTNIQLRNMGY